MLFLCLLYTVCLSNEMRMMLILAEFQRIHKRINAHEKREKNALEEPFKFMIDFQVEFNVCQSGAKQEFYNFLACSRLSECGYDLAANTLGACRGGRQHTFNQPLLYITSQVIMRTITRPTFCFLFHSRIAIVSIHLQCANCHGKDSNK